MREFSTPPASPHPTSGSLADDVVRNAAEHPDRVAFSRAVVTGGQREWSPVTAAAFCDAVRRVAKGLVAAGVEAGDRVVVLAGTRYEWTLVDYALWYAGAVGVPVYETSAPDQLAWILRDSGARWAVVGSAGHAGRLRDAAEAPLEALWLLDPEEPGHPGALEQLTTAGAAVSDEELEGRRAALGPRSVATLVYTSGTTGMPRGCVLTHGSLMVGLDAALAELGALFEGEDAATLLVLPMAHVFARIVQVGAVRAGVRLGHSGDPRHFLADLASFSPTFLLGVPRVFEKVFNTASQEAAAAGRSRAFDRATDVAIAWSLAQEPGRRRPLPRPLLRAQHALMDRLVYAALRARLGGRCRYAVSGGAPLGERLGHFYRGIGVPVLEGYGLTETSGATTVNRPDALRVGTVGQPLPGTGVRVAEDGELLVRGGHLMEGYWGDPEGTAAVLGADGWLRTGDLGEIDDEGFVRITGRKKEIIVTAGGKNVAAGMLEDRVRAHPLVGQCLVVGDGRPYVAALVTLDHESVAVWARTHGLRGRPRDLVHDPALRAEVQKAVDDANRTVSQAESIRRFTVLAEEWSEETGELTPSLKLRRNLAVRRYRRHVEALYD